MDAFGIGGFDLGLTVAGRYYPIYSVRKIVAGVCRTPMVDGSGLRQILEHRIAQYVEQTIGPEVHPKRVLIPAAVDRYGLALSFAEAGYDLLFGDLGFGLGLPIPLRSLPSISWPGFCSRCCPGCPLNGSTRPERSKRASVPVSLNGAAGPP
ncbi:MAG: hypothetical protein D6793_01705 [Thermoflexia bacterium]|nr:MAG: hypothetical protein D6793_01705 [Thermoflexia bacterium]